MLHLAGIATSHAASIFVAPWALLSKMSGAVVKAIRSGGSIQKLEIAIAKDQAEHTWPEFVQRLRKILDLPTLARLVLCVSSWIPPPPPGLRREIENEWLRNMEQLQKSLHTSDIIFRNEAFSQLPLVVIDRIVAFCEECRADFLITNRRFQI